mmetsp:Transcript_47646/g.157938  ORF Transcript_47646/g.157938 Transcript_47646/m.157938 type:complete len:333 (-) Transcript_47646:32-1030(-)
MPSKAASRRVATVAVCWLMQARGVAPPDADRLERLGITKIVQLVLVRSIGRGASAMLDLLARVLLLLIALLLSWSPETRAAAMHRVVCEMRRHSHHLRNLGTIPEITVDGDSDDVCGESDENYAADAPRPTPSGGSEDACAPAVADSADGGPPRVLVLGERGVGGSALVEALRTLAAAEGIDLPIERHVDGVPPHSVAVQLSLVVWEASLERPLAEYVADHLRADGQGAAIVVCSKTDRRPCPLPQIHALAEAHPFIAVSVEKQTNVALLWGMVRAALAAPPSPPPPSIDGSGAPLPGTLPLAALGTSRQSPRRGSSGVFGGLRRRSSHSSA